MFFCVFPHTKILRRASFTLQVCISLGVLQKCPILIWIQCPSIGECHFHYTYKNPVMIKLFVNAFTKAKSVYSYIYPLPLYRSTNLLNIYCRCIFNFLLSWIWNLFFNNWNLFVLCANGCKKVEHGLSLSLKSVGYVLVDISVFKNILYLSVLIGFGLAFSSS